MINKTEILTLLNTLQIEYELIEHPPVYTMEEMNALQLPKIDKVAKNLFVRDDKKRNYYLLVVKEEKKINLKDFRKNMSLRPLSFASNEDLEAILNLSPGSVSPLGILNDTQNKVVVYIDVSFQDTSIGIHPNENTATLWLQTKDLVQLLKEHGNTVEFIKI